MSDDEQGGWERMSDHDMEYHSDDREEINERIEILDLPQVF